MDSHTAPMPVLTAINERRSVRAYKPERVPRDTLLELMRAAVRAPTAIHEEQWAFAVIQGRERLKQLSEETRAPFAAAVGTDLHAPGLHFHATTPDFNLFYDADTLILICTQPMGPFVAADCWLAAENLMLAAHAMGLGTCVIGSASVGLNQPEIKAQLGLAAEIQVIVPLIVGWPADAGAPTARRAPEVLSWIAD